jgi:photosystem II stability/assembly factor-like uncharacterized protein
VDIMSDKKGVICGSSEIGEDLKNFKNVEMNMRGRYGWKVTGPGGGGYIGTPAVSPRDAQTIMVSSDMGGTYVTHDGGEKWFMANFSGTAACIYFDPDINGRIYLGSNGLYRSDDNGFTWRMIYGYEHKGARITAVTKSGGIIYIASCSSEGNIIKYAGEEDADRYNNV